VKCLAAFPHVSIVNKLGLSLSKFEQEFGMTPSARSRIECSAEEAEPESIEEYLKQRYLSEKYFNKPRTGMSAEEAMDILEKSKPPPELKIDRREPELGKPTPPDPDLD
jgi:hypothetical protein